MFRGWSLSGAILNLFISVLIMGIINMRSFNQNLCPSLAATEPKDLGNKDME